MRRDLENVMKRTLNHFCQSQFVYKYHISGTLELLRSDSPEVIFSTFLKRNVQNNFGLYFIA